MHRQKYHILLFILSIPFLFMTTKNWVSERIEFTGRAYPFLVLFATFAEIYFSKRKLVIAGMIAMGAFVVGIFLTAVHWPGERLFLVTSALALISIPLWSALTSAQQKALKIIIAIWILIFGISFLFRLFGWPAGLLYILSMLYLPLVTIALGISILKSKQQENHGNV